MRFNYQEKLIELPLPDMALALGKRIANLRECARPNFLEQFNSLTFKEQTVYFRDLNLDSCANFIKSLPTASKFYRYGWSGLKPLCMDSGSQIIEFHWDYFFMDFCGINLNAEVRPRKVISPGKPKSPEKLELVLSPVVRPEAGLYLRENGTRSWMSSNHSEIREGVTHLTYGTPFEGHILLEQAKNGEKQKYQFQNEPPSFQLLDYDNFSKKQFQKLQEAIQEKNEV